MPPTDPTPSQPGAGTSPDQAHMGANPPDEQPASPGEATGVFEDARRAVPSADDDVADDQHPPDAPDAQDEHDEDAPPTLAMAALKPSDQVDLAGQANPEPQAHEPETAPVPDEDAQREAPSGEQPQPGLEEPPLVVVVQLSGPEDGRGTLVRLGSALIGRHTEGITVELLHDQWVSRRHAQLTYRAGKWLIEDLGSSNGTWRDADHIRIREAEAIELGKVFRVGHTDLMLSDDLSLAEQRPAQMV